MAIQKKTPAESDKLLKYLQAVDNICGYSKDKRNIVIQSQLHPMDSIYWDLQD